VVSGEVDIGWERKAFAEMRMEDGYWGAQEISVFCVVAVRVVG